MYDFINIMKTKKIIDKDDITFLKEDINKNYPHLDKRDRASLLAKSIHTILDKKLNNFSEETRNHIKNELIKNKLTKNNIGLYEYDVLEICLSIKDKNEKILDEVSNFVGENLAIDGDKKEISNYILSLYEEDKIYTEKKQSTNDIKASTTLSKKYLIIALSIFLLILPLINNLYKKSNIQLETLSSENLEMQSHSSDPLNMEYSHLDFSHIPLPLRYREMNWENLRSYLSSRNSILAIEPYFSDIINSAKKFNLNPLILFSIAGHEQAFVPMDHKFAKEMANNPFNVYRSWEEYNTTIVDSATITARTVFNLLKDRPEEENPFKWINRKYAQDRNWYRGVWSIYKMLEEEIKK